MRTSTRTLASLFTFLFFLLEFGHAAKLDGPIIASNRKVTLIFTMTQGNRGFHHGQNVSSGGGGTVVVGCVTLTLSTPISEDASGCGNQATNPYNGVGTALPASSTCATLNAAISAGTAGSPNIYRLVQDAGSAAAKTANCLTPKNNVIINLDRFHHYGNVCLNGDANQWILENGFMDGNNDTTISTCGGQGGVWTFTNSGVCPTQSNQLRYLTLTNASTNDQSQDIHLDVSTAADCSVPYLLVDHVSSTSPPLSGGSRTTNIYIQGNRLRTFVQAKVTNTAVTFQPGSNAQQGIMFYQCSQCWADGNYVNAVQVNAGLGDSGRALVADGAEVSSGGDVGCNACKFTNNVVRVNNNRGSRLRNSQNTIWQSNWFLSISTSNGFEGTAAHMGDPDLLNYDLAALDWSSNRIELVGTSSVGMWLRSAFMTGGLINSNIFYCSSCATPVTELLRQPASTGTRSEWTIKNTTYTSFTGNAKAQYGRPGDSSPVYSYGNGCTATPVADTSAGTSVAPTLTPIACP